MDTQKVDMYIVSNNKYFEPYQISQIRERLLQLDENKWAMLQSVPLKDPTTSLIISILLGGLGIDRFMIGDIGLGIGKLLTCGGGGIWTIIDWFLISKDTRIKNFTEVQKYIY